MVDRIYEQHIHVPDGCAVKTMVVPLKHLTDQSYIRVFTEGLETIARDKDLTGQDFRVLLDIMAIMEWENFLNITQKELAERLELFQGDVSKSIKKLIDKGYIKITEKIGRQNIYQVSPNLGFKSRAKNIRVMKSDWNENLEDTEDLAK